MTHDYLEPEGTLRVWAIRNPPNKPTYHQVATPEQGAHLIDELAISDLQDRGVFSNAFGLEVLEDGEWHEWYDEKDNSVQDLLDAMEAQGQ